MNTVVIVLIISMVMFFVGIFAAGILMTGADGDGSRKQSSVQNGRLGDDSGRAPSPNDS